MPLLGRSDSDLHSRVSPDARTYPAWCAGRSITPPPPAHVSIPPQHHAQNPTSSKSTSYVPRPATVAPPRPGNQLLTQRIIDSHVSLSIREDASDKRCSYLHICNFCGGAHARFVYAQSSKLWIKNLRITYRLPWIFLTWPLNSPIIQIKNFATIFYPASATV